MSRVQPSHLLLLMVLVIVYVAQAVAVALPAQHRSSNVYRSCSPVVQDIHHVHCMLVYYLYVLYKNVMDIDIVVVGLLVVVVGFAEFVVVSIDDYY